MYIFYWILNLFEVELKQIEQSICSRQLFIPFKNIIVNQMRQSTFTYALIEMLAIYSGSISIIKYYEYSANGKFGLCIFIYTKIQLIRLLTVQALFVSSDFEF